MPLGPGPYLMMFVAPKMKPMIRPTAVQHQSPVLCLVSSCTVTHSLPSYRPSWLGDVSCLLCLRSVDVSYLCRGWTALTCLLPQRSTVQEASLLPLIAPEQQITVYYRVVDVDGRLPCEVRGTAHGSGRCRRSRITCSLMTAHQQSHPAPTFAARSRIILHETARTSINPGP